MSAAIVTGSGRLIGSESVRFFADMGLDVAGIDNDMRASCFSAGASTKFYAHLQADIPDIYAVGQSFAGRRSRWSSTLRLVSIRLMLV
jgi:CDP-paratose 2-epimerase